MSHITIPTDQLPTWMRRSLRGTDWAALLSLLFCLLVALVIFWQTGFPRSNDSEHWVFRTANTAAALQEGRLYPRWSPHALGGYGAPIPHYYPPAPAYIAALIQISFTGDPVEAVRLVMILALGLSGIPVYHWVARRAGSAAGVLASILYVYSPIIGYVTPAVLGDLPAVLSHLLLPTLLASLDRFLTTGQRLDFAAIALLLAALLLTDPRFAAVGIVLSLIYMVWHRWRHPSRAWRTVLLALLLGALISAFYWLPAYLEIDAVGWRQVTTTAPYRVDLAALFTPLHQPDPLNSNVTPQFTLGTPMLFLLPIGVWAALWRRSGFHGLFLLLSALLVGILAFMPSATWLVGILALTCAIGASAAATLRIRFASRLRALSLTLIVLIATTSALPMWLARQATEPFGDLSPAAQVQYELQGFGIAGLPRGWLLPSSFAGYLPYNQNLISSYTSDAISKIDVSTVTNDAQIGFLGNTAHSDRFQIQTGIPTQITILTAKFPGWSASATSGNARLFLDRENGLLRLDLPANFNSDLTISLGTTIPRAVAWTLSSVAFLALVIITRRSRPQRDALADYPLLQLAETRALSVVLVLVTTLALLALNGGLSTLQNRPGAELDGYTPLRLRSEVGMEAIAFRLDTQTAQQSSMLQFSLYWRALRYLERNYRVQVSLVPIGSDVATLTTPLAHPGGYPARRWLTGRYVTDSYALPLPADLATGDYQLRVEVFDCDQVCTAANRLTFFDPQGAALQSWLLPATIRISP
jgi:hypothetical protein